MNPEAAARTAIAFIREHYDESIFPSRPKGPHTEVYDGEFAYCARLICDNILREFERILHDDDDEDEAEEVEVTTDVEAVRIVPPKMMRRSGAKNVVSSPRLQAAFIDEARVSMGQPTGDDAVALRGKQVKLVFNVDKAPVTGILTEVIFHPASVYLVIDDNQNLLYPLNSLQSIEEA